MEFKVKYFYLKVSDNMNIYIKTPQAVLNLIKDDFEIDEKIIVVGMNIKNKVIIKKDIAIGNYNTVMCTPASIFIPLLKVNARNFILAHNHLSEDPTPSKEDIIFTSKMRKASEIVGFNFLDHLIVAAEEHYSFKENNLL